MHSHTVSEPPLSWSVCVCERERERCLFPVLLTNMAFALMPGLLSIQVSEGEVSGAI